MDDNRDLIEALEGADRAFREMYGVDHPADRDAAFLPVHTRKAWAAVLVALERLRSKVS